MTLDLQSLHLFGSAYGEYRLLAPLPLPLLLLLPLPPVPNPKRVPAVLDKSLFSPILRLPSDVLVNSNGEGAASLESFYSRGHEQRGVSERASERRRDGGRDGGGVGSRTFSHFLQTMCRCQGEREGYGNGFVWHAPPPLRVFRFAAITRPLVARPFGLLHSRYLHPLPTTPNHTFRIILVLAVVE